MRNISIKSIIIILGVVITLLACNENDSELIVGSDWVNTSTKVFFIDTISVKSSTFKLDTLDVAYTDRYLIGSYKDAVFGTVRAKTYLQLSPSSFYIDDDAQYDSIALVLKYDKYTYNDTIPYQGLNIYEVTEDIEISDDYPSYYNTTEFEYNPTPLANTSFQYRPNKVADSLSITLNYDFGEEIFNKINDNDINNIDEFLKEYKGILIDPIDTNTMVFGISTDSYVRVYYSTNVELEDDDESLHIDFNINTANSFHNVSSNLQNTTIQALQTGAMEIPSSSTDDKSYIQAGTGIATKIDIPSIESLYDISGDGIMLSANLKISLKKDVNEDILPTRDSLQVYIIDEDYAILGELYASADAENVSYAEIETEDNEFNITTYSIPVNYFLTQKLSLINGDELFLAVYPQDYTKSVDRYIFYNENASNDVKLKVEIIYAVYDE